MHGTVIGANGKLSEAVRQVLDSWRKKLVTAMKQGYYLVLALGDGGTTLRYTLLDYKDSHQCMI